MAAGDVRLKTRWSSSGLEAAVKTRIGAFDFAPEGFVAGFELDGRPIFEDGDYDVESRSEHTLSIFCEP